MRSHSPRRLIAVAVALITSSCARYAAEPRFGGLTRDERPFTFRHNMELFEVSNGMRVVLIPDRRTNLATVDVRYAVGSAEDPAGKTGLAHLVEHLAFEVRAEPGGPTLFEELGEVALYFNAYTTFDETHYTSTVPIEQLEHAIAIEGRRMRASCDQIDEAVFERERDVVLAEEAQRSGPLDGVWREIMGAVYGPGHPYARPVSSNDMATATRADACGFIAQYYAPNRAYAVITGPFDPAQVRALVGKTFGPIKRQARPRESLDAADPAGSNSRITAPVEHPLVLVVFPWPAWGSDVTSSLVRSRLASALADADSDHGWILDSGVMGLGGTRAPALAAWVEISDEARFGDATREIFTRAGSLFADVKRRDLARLIGAKELQLVARWDDLGSRGGWIADYLQYTEHNGFMIADMRTLERSDWDGVARASADTFSDTNSHVIHIRPSGKAAERTLAAAIPAGAHALVPWRAPVDVSEADRALEVTPAPVATVERYLLDNGLTVELAPDPHSPIVDARIVFPVGSAAEPPDRYGVSTAAAGLLEQDLEGFYERSMLDKLDWALSRGTQLGWAVDEFSTTFVVTGGSAYADWHVWYLSWLLDQGRYNQATLDRMHATAREISKSADEDEIDAASLAFRSRLFGTGHPYATPPPEAGAAFLRLGATDLARWKATHYRADGATLVVSGAFDPEAMKREVRELFGPWSGSKRAALPAVPPVRPAKGPSWLAAADEDANQVSITIGYATRSDPVVDRAAQMVLREMLEDDVRVVREGMGASYGIHVSQLAAAAGGSLLVFGEVDQARAGEALRLITAAIARLRDDAGGARAAFVRARRKALALALARRGGAATVSAQLADLAARGLPPDRASELAREIAALTPAHVGKIAAADLAEARMVVLVRGPRAAVEATCAALGITPEWPAKK